MISKCQNIVINRTKFSDFEDWDIISNSTDGLKVVGYIDVIDECSGEKINKNVAINFSDIIDLSDGIPSNYFVDNLQNFYPINGYMTCYGDVPGYTRSFRIHDKFEGNFIQLNIPSAYDGDTRNVFAELEDGKVKELVLSFDRTIPFGKVTQILIKGFPAKTQAGITYKIKLIDYETRGDVPSVSDIIFESSTKYSEEDKLKNILITFAHSALSNAISVKTGEATISNKKMAVTNVEIVE